MKTSELTGAALDSMVARAEGLAPTIQDWAHTPMGGIVRDRGPLCVVLGTVYRPAADWGQGGLIIERQNIVVIPAGLGADKPKWRGAVVAMGSPGILDLTHQQLGATYLEAAMRAYVASKFGEEVPDGD